MAKVEHRPASRGYHHAALFSSGGVMVGTNRQTTWSIDDARLGGHPCDWARKMRPIFGARRKRQDVNGPWPVRNEKASENALSANNRMR